MESEVRTALLARRRAQIAAWVSLIGIIGCFVVLVTSEHRLGDGGEGVRFALIVFLLGYFGAVLYLRMRKCPACGNRFSGSMTRVVGAYKEMSIDECQHCGATLR